MSVARMGILFGGVSDDDKDEETLDSTFYNELCVTFPEASDARAGLSPSSRS